MPALDGGDDFVEVGGPIERLGMGIVIVPETIDGGLEVCDRAEDASFEASLGQAEVDPVIGTGG